MVGVMPQWDPDLLLLARRRTVRVAAVALPLLGVALGWVPLLSLPGFELSMVAAWIAVPLGAALGIGAAHRERERSWPAMAPSPWRAWGFSFTVLAALLLLMLAASVLQAVFRSPCSPLAQIGFFPALTLPSGALACALGVLSGLVTRRRWLAGLLVAALAAVFLGATLLQAWKGPEAFALDHLFGYWPGPIYDEALRVDHRLLVFRGLTVLWVLAVLALAGLAAQIGAVQRALIPRTVLILAVTGAALVAAHSRRSQLGYAMTHEHLARQLGGRSDGARCTVFYPAERREVFGARLLRECEFGAARVAAALGIERPPTAAVYLYRSDEEKRRLTGAGATDYTKPWRAEIHISDEPLPHPVLRHELVHALGSALSDGWLGVPARAGVLVSAGLVEGLAVAVELPRGEWTVHQWSRAMRDLGLMPSPARLVGPAGFFATAPARAYTVAGSFLAFLLERHGTAPVQAIYRGRDPAGAMGKSLPDLEAEWNGFLDGVAVPPGLAAAAEERYRAESLFARRCAREVAALGARASRLAREGRAADAASLWRQAGTLAGGEPGYLRAAGDAWRNAGGLDAAELAYRDALTQLDRAGPNKKRAMRGMLEAALGDLAWRRGDFTGAGERYRAAAELVGDRSQSRLVAAKLAALADPALRETAGPWLLDLGDPVVRFARLREGTGPLADYLVGRTLLQRGAAAQALRALDAARGGRLPDPGFEVEAARMLAQAQCDAGHWADGIADYEALGRRAQSDAERLLAADGAARCAFERDAYGAPVPTEP
jgi:hypothetical protein